MVVTAAEMEAEEKRVATEVARALDECCLSHAVQPRKLKELAALRRSSGAGHEDSLFFAAFTRALAPLFDFPRRTLSSERIVRFVAAFAARRDEKDAAACDAFLEEFLRFLLTAAVAAHRPARFRACQIISEIIVRLPDDAEMSDEVWDEVINIMKDRIRDKIPAIRAFAVRALSRFASDEEDNGIVDIFLQSLTLEQNAEVRRAIVLSLPPSVVTCDAIIGSTLDVSESVRKVAYTVLSNKFPLQSLSIKLRTIILQRGLSDRSLSVTKECLKMLKDEWLTKCCQADVVTLLRFLDVETYESVGEAVMEALLKDGQVQVKDGQSLRQYLPTRTEGECNSGTQLMEAEAALYWKTLCKHLQTEAQVKGTDSATTTGTEAAVYASEASDKNDLLEGILPLTTSDYVDLVKMHLSAGPNYRFVSRQLLLLGTMLDFSDSTNRKVASAFVHELLLQPLEYEVDDDGNKVLIGDGISLGGDKDWAKSISELARKVHASAGEFEATIARVLEELAQPCRERTADFMQWMHCLALTGLLLENVNTLSSLQGKAIEPSELLHSLLLPGAKQSHIEVQRIAVRCLGLFGLLQRRPAQELVKQLRLSFINGTAPVRIMASKCLVDLVTWHGPQEVDRAFGIEIQQLDNETEEFTSVHVSSSIDDVTAGVLDLLHSRLSEDDSEEVDDDESVCSVLGEGFAKILLLSQNYPSISACLHSLILQKLIKLYFCEETKGLERLKQCLSVFFENYSALSDNHKKCVSSSLIPVMQSIWPGIYGNPSGSSVFVSKMRKRTMQVSRFMLQMMQSPLFVKEPKGEESTELRAGSLPSSMQTTHDFVSGEEGLALRIATEVATFPEKKTAAGKSYILTLCRLAVLVQFRQSEQEAIKCMRGLLNCMIISASTDKELVKDLNRMAARLRSLDEHPEEELSPEQITAALRKLGLDVNLSIAMSAVLPPTPAPRSTRTAPSRRKVKHQVSSSDDDEPGNVPEVVATPSIASVRHERASKAAAMSRMTAKTVVKYSNDQEDPDSDVTSEETSDDSSDGSE